MAPLLKSSLLLSLGLLAVAPLSAEETKELSAPAQQLQKLVIDAGAGDLQVRGVQALSEITAKVRIYCPKDHPIDADDYWFELQVDGDQARLFSKGHNRHDDLHMDLQVSMPYHLSLYVGDGSGSMDIENIGGQVKIDDGSGDARIHNIAKTLRVDDGSGDLDIYGIGSNVTIHDGSGEIVLASVTGDAEVRDNSGDMEINAISGNLDIEDGSGNIQVRAVGGVVSMEDGSGNIEVDDAKQVVVHADGSGKVLLKNIREGNAYSGQ
ncbi:hypothetical protein P2G88_00365 [Aliiglaciecola sp. CAU 1673]|uniref:hypothetical protein n=1 Tax=Aliiglaciecola sp. CAU 1673 TaxID=3032595 RepID=UPI0023DB89AB|nr:hypothetical protein [Aliiglaciecola sp. CAU 1673]MDF2176700.1 hypothetical protein [Aliiglaciecola sp. CAU 1673]